MQKQNKNSPRKKGISCLSKGDRDGFSGNDPNNTFL